MISKAIPCPVGHDHGYNDCILRKILLNVLHVLAVNWFESAQFELHIYVINI